VTILVRHPRTHAAERLYAFDVVLREGLDLDWRSIPEDRADVELGLACATARIRLPDDVFASPEAGWPAALRLPERPLRVLRGALVRAATGADELPLLFGSPGAGPGAVREEGDETWLDVDVFGTAFVLLSRLEELRDAPRDVHGRFPAAASLAVRLGVLERPLVDEHVELLRAVLERTFPGLPGPRPRYSEAITHDVDFVDGRRLGVARSLRSAARHLVTDRAPRAAGRRLASVPLRPLMGPRGDVFNTFGDLMRQSERNGLRSTFFFIAGSAEGGIDDDNYEIGEPFVRSVLREIAAQGHEIGLHGSYQSFASADRLGAELAALRAVLQEEGIDERRIGCRQHFLRFDPAVTWRAQAEAGLVYDSTVGFAELPGFRSGTCREHSVFDVAGRRRLPLRERPLTLMDSTILDAAYLGLGRDEAGRTAERLKSACRRVGGTFRLLWHNTMLVTPAQRALYGDILAC
jgi:hypothetical protein